MTDRRRRAGRLVLALVAGPALAWSAWLVGAGRILSQLPVAPPTPAIGPVGPWGTALAAALVPASWISIPREGPGAVGLLSMAAGVLVVAAYPWVTLDWSVLLLDLGLTRGGVPPARAVGAALAPLGVAWAGHAILLSGCCEDHYEGKGLPEDEVRAATRAVRRWSVPPAVAGLVGATLAWAGFRYGAVPASLAPALGPLVVATVVAAAAVLGVRRARGLTGG